MERKPKSIIDIESYEQIIPVEPLSTDDFLLPEDKLPGIEQFEMSEQPLQDRCLPARLDNITHCPRCNKVLTKAISISGAESESFLECSSCGTLINTFYPTYYQAMFLSRGELYKMTSGGFGTGKSRTNIEDVIKHLLLIPGGRVVVAARSYPVISATFSKEFDTKFPAKLVLRKNEMKHEMTLTNGSELIYRSFDDPSKLKSINASMAVIVEASDVKYTGFTMMQSRVRNVAAMIPELDADGNVVMVWDEAQKGYRIKYRVDARHINLETNPDSGWVKTHFLLDSKVIEFFGDAYNEGYRIHTDPDPNKYSQVVSTSANPYLPETYEAEQTRGKSAAYVQQYFKGSFNFSSNLVFPNFGTCIVPPHALPRAFNELGRRVLFFLIGIDYGISDPTHVMFSAFSTETKKLYVYDELRMDNSDVRAIAVAYRKRIRENGTDLRGLLMQPRFDGRSYNKRESDLKSIGKMFEDEGLFFEPSFSSHSERIMKLNSLINYNQIEVFATCEFAIEEFLNYKFKLDTHGDPTGVPVDGKDHGITGLEFSIVELPHNLQELQLNAYLPPGTHHYHDRKIDVARPNSAQPYDPLKEDNYAKHSIGNTHTIARIPSLTIQPAFSIFDQEDESGKDDKDNNSGFAKELSAYIPRY